MSRRRGSLRRRLGVVLLAVWVVLWVASSVVRWNTPVPPIEPRDEDEVVLILDAVDGDRRLENRPVATVVRDLAGPVRPDAAMQDGAPAVPADPARPVVLLLHGSPGSQGEMLPVARLLSRRARVIVPDLPGFGRSERELPDYSVRAHAHYMAQAIEQLDTGPVHVVGFSMGGGVALNLYDIAPDRVKSVTLLAAIGVQELELLGEYRVNHAVHGLQLAFLAGLRSIFPHFGFLDRTFMGVEYARNFYDTDQRPLRGILSRLEPPTLVLHGARDPLVPAAAAREHHRLVPQSALVVWDDESHFTAFMRPEKVATELVRFFDAVETGQAPTRTAAEPSRRVAAVAPFDPGVVPEAEGLALILLALLIIVGTLVSEDLTCIITGLLVAQGRLSLLAGSAACFVGILIGDLLLFSAGRIIGRRLLNVAPFRWWIDPRQLHRSSAWLARRGPVVIFLTRFMPGVRLPTYVTAGVLHTRFIAFAFWFALAAAVWTPLVVWLSGWLGVRSLALFDSIGTGGRLAAVLTMVLLIVGVRLLALSLTHRGRRRLVGAWRRWSRWEFWPPWLFYPPVVAYVLALGVRHRSPTVFTAANPCMPAGGFVGESKSAILAALAQGGAPVAPFRVLPATMQTAERLAEARHFVDHEGGGFPLVVKPDVGERGTGVSIIRDGAALDAVLATAPGAQIVQRYVPGVELGVFYVRRPDEESGFILSITEKRLPEITGDGRHTIERLILDDPRAVILASVYLRELQRDAAEIPAAGEAVRLVDVGTHCRGALFLDGGWAATPELSAAVERFSRGVEGFFFGRYDLRAPDAEAFCAGRDLAILELNGVTSESTNIYDPGHGLLDAYRLLFRQWRLAFEVGAANRKRGSQPTSARELFRMLRRHGAAATPPPETA